MDLHLFNGFYNTIHKYCLVSLGLWPQQSKIEKRCTFAFFVISAISLILALSAGLSEDWSTDPLVIIENILSIIFLVSGLVKGTFLFAHQNKLLKLYDRIATHWEQLTDKKEIEILQSHTQDGQNIAFTSVLLVVPAFLIFGLITFLPTMFRTITVNEYPHIFPYYFDCMIIYDGLRHYQIFVHSAIVFTYVGASYMATSSTFIASIKHTCGLFAITCYRLQTAIKINGIYPFIQLKHKKSIISNLIGAIDIHTEALYSVDQIEQIYTHGFLVLEITGLLDMAIIITEAMWQHDTVLQIFRIIFINIIFVIYLFCINWTGEQVIRFSNDVRSTAYFIDWYIIPIEARKLVHMILRRTSNTPKLTAGSLTILSMKNFGSILRTSWSTATVLVSTRRNHK